MFCIAKSEYVTPFFGRITHLYFNGRKKILKLVLQCSVFRSGINPVSWILSRFDYTTAVLMNLLNIGWCKGYFNGRKKILKLGLKCSFFRSGINHVS